MFFTAAAIATGASYARRLEIHAHLGRAIDLVICITASVRSFWQGVLTASALDSLVQADDPHSRRWHEFAKEKKPWRKLQQ